MRTVVLSTRPTTIDTLRALGPASPRLANASAAPLAAADNFVWIDAPAAPETLTTDAHVLALGDAREHEAFCDEVLRPMFRGLPGTPRAHDGIHAYESVNARFALRALQESSEGDVFWVHDLALLLAPSFLRVGRPDARIGFFLQEPFPAPELFARLPFAATLLRGMLGADLVGFHTESSRAAFLTAAARLLPVRVHESSVELFLGRTVRAEVFAEGIQRSRFEGRADLHTTAEFAALQAQWPEAKLLLGINPLAPTREIPQRLLAFERLLERDASLVGTVCLVQVAVPSREGPLVDASHREHVARVVERINARYTFAGAIAPVRYLARKLTHEAKIALYRACDVMVATPLHESASLVAKEFVASRRDLAGVLVASEFGAVARQLRDAVRVDPHDLDAFAAALGTALRMPEDERRTRMTRLRAALESESSNAWAASFLESLRAIPTRREGRTQ